MSQASPLAGRIHSSPQALARSPGDVAEHISSVSQAMLMTLALLQPLPTALASRWLATDRGHVILHEQRHGFVAGEQFFRGRALVDVAWLRLSWLLRDPITYLTPVGWLILRQIGWEQRERFAQKPWRDFASGVASGFRAGYGRSEAARAQVDAYLAEGIAWYLADPRGLNVADPRLHKLLRATLFNETFYRP